MKLAAINFSFIDIFVIYSKISLILQNKKPTLCRLAIYCVDFIVDSAHNSMYGARIQKSELIRET